MIARRSFIIGLGSSLAAPAIVRAASIMPVKALPLDVYGRSPAMDALDAIHEFDLLPFQLEYADLIVAWKTWSLR